MTLRQSVHLMQRWLFVIVAGVVVGVAVGWLSAPGAAGKTVTFQATNTLLLDPQGEPGFQIQRAAVLAELGNVPSRVAARLGIDRRRVQAMVITYIPASEGELLVTGRSTDRAQAEALANVTAEELIVELGGPTSPLRTLEPAVASPVGTGDFQGPTSRPDRALLLGAFGLLLGVGAAFAVERFDNRIRSKRTAEEALGVPVVAEVPAIRRSDRDRLDTGARPSAFIESYRLLRSNVERWTPAAGKDDGHRVIVVTSPTGGEGTTTTVAHLAVTLAEMGRSVLVISADLRRPRLHLYFDRPREPGLADLLRGAPDARRVTDLTLGTAILGIQCLSSGTPVDDPAPLIDQLGDVLGDARNLCDFVLVDTPALLTVSDAAILARHADGVLLAVRAGQTTVGAAARSAELLQRLDIPVLGAVLVAGGAALTISGSPGQRSMTRRRESGSPAATLGDRAPSR